MERARCRGCSRPGLCAGETTSRPSLATRSESRTTIDAPAPAWRRRRGPNHTHPWASQASASTFEAPGAMGPRLPPSPPQSACHRDAKQSASRSIHSPSYLTPAPPYERRDSLQTSTISSDSGVCPVRENPNVVVVRRGPRDPSKSSVRMDLSFLDKLCIFLRCDARDRDRSIRACTRRARHAIRNV